MIIWKINGYVVIFGNFGYGSVLMGNGLCFGMFVFEVQAASVRARGGGTVVSIYHEEESERVREGRLILFKFLLQMYHTL